MLSRRSEDPPLFSKDGSSKKRKRVSIEKQPESRPKTKQPESRPKTKGLRVTGRDPPGPRVQLAYSVDGLCDDEEVLKIVGIALSSWNERSLSEKGPEYELVKPLGCKTIIGPSIYHCNFIARPKNASEDENKLFFAEVQCSLDDMDGEDGALGCSVCCIIGSSGTVTGLFGCKICHLHPNLIQHPENGEFTKGRNDARAKFNRKRRQALQTETGCFGYNI